MISEFTNDSLGSSAAVQSILATKLLQCLSTAINSQSPVSSERLINLEKRSFGDSHKIQDKVSANISDGMETLPAVVEAAVHRSPPIVLTAVAPHWRSRFVFVAG